MDEYYRTWDMYNEEFKNDLKDVNIVTDEKLGPPLLAKCFFADYATKENRFIVASDENTIISLVRYNPDPKKIKAYTGYKIPKIRVRYCIVFKDESVSKNFYDSILDIPKDLIDQGEIVYFVPKELYPEDKSIRSNDKNIMITNKVFEKESSEVKKKKKDDEDEEENEDDENEEFLQEKFVRKEINVNIEAYVNNMASEKSDASITVDVDKIRMMIAGTILLNNPNFL